MIVFLHGWGMDKSIFQAFVDEYLSEESVLLLDLPGYGESEYRLNDNLGFEESFDCQVEWLKDQIPEGTHVVAWSMAGLYVLKLNERFKGHMSRLSLVCSTPSFAQRQGFEHALSATVLEDFSESLVLNRSKTVDRFLMLQLHGQSKGKEVFKIIKKQMMLMPEVCPRVLDFGMQVLMNVDCRDALKSTQIPVQFILGERDKLVPIEVSKDLKDIKKQVEIVKLEKVAHLPFVTHSKLFYEAVFR